MLKPAEISAKRARLVAILEFISTDVRNYDPVVVFAGNPPLAAVDIGSASAGFASVNNVLSNDIAGDTAIDPTKVTIIAGPGNGTAVVNPTNGDISYSGNTGFTGTDAIYYRVKDLNGNDSTIGTLIISVF
jgi:hypothetical protein